MGILALLSAAICIWLFTDLVESWANYNLRMLRRLVNNIFPFFLFHFGLACFVFVLEAFVVGWKNSSLRAAIRPDKSMVNDTLAFLVNSLQLDYILIFLLTFGLLHKIRIGIKVFVGLEDGLLSFIPWIPLQFIAYIILADFLGYWQHWFHHKLSFLWPFHSYHHSATELNVLTASRGHPIQTEFTNQLIVVIPLLLIGVPLVPLLSYRLIRNGLAFMHHSRLPWDWGWFGKYVVVSPGFHRYHHSVLPEHYDKNLAILFPIWDHLFGTYYKGSVPPSEMGIPENPYNHKGFVHDLFVPFKMFRRKRKEKALEDTSPARRDSPIEVTAV
jgi:sterol desaturase/sphingolipid hydroxylase (fatty acid hydroxylase superfamily)